jgi:hypothetical protein
VVVIALPGHLGRLREQVVNAPAFGALAARRQTRYQGIVGYVQVDHDRFGQAALLEQGGEDSRLRHCPRVTVQQKPIGAIGLGDAVSHNAIHDVVTDQASPRHNLGDSLAQFRAGFLFRAEHFASRYGRYVETRRKEGSLRTFATSGRAKKK